MLAGSLHLLFYSIAPGVCRYPSHASPFRVLEWRSFVQHVNVYTTTRMTVEALPCALSSMCACTQVTADQLAADEQQAIVEKDVEEANKVAANVQVIKDDCQKVWTVPLRHLALSAGA